MDDSLLVRVLQRLANFWDNAKRLGWRKFSRLKQLPQRQAVHKFHQQIKISLRFAEIINRHDVRMMQFCQRARFALESFGEFRFALFFRRKNFQRDNPVQSRLARFIDRAHAAAPEAFENFQLRK